MKGKGADKLDELRKKLQADEVFSMTDEKFFGRQKELSELKAFIENDRKRIFCLYGIPMMGKSTLTKAFCKTITGYQITRVIFNNPENPETTLENAFTGIDLKNAAPTLIVIENFEEALLWKGDHDHLHEIKFQKVTTFLQKIASLDHIKLIIESRFLVKVDPDLRHMISRLSDDQLGSIERIELFNALNERYRNNRVQYADFEKICDKFNDHVWLIELAMQDDFEYLHVQEAMSRPQSVTEQLWKIVEKIIQSLPLSNRTLLCAFGIVNPMHEAVIKEHLAPLEIFSKMGELDDALFSLIRKLLLIRDPSKPLYELNPFLREICFTYLQGQKEMKTIEQIPFFQKVQKPKYDHIFQAHIKGDYRTFFELIKEKRRKKEYTLVLDILQEVYEYDLQKVVILNEMAITYKWQKNYPKAIEILEKALKIEPNNVKVLDELAIVYKVQKNYPKAIEILEKALKIEPKNVPSFNELAIVYKEQKKYTKAIDVHEKALIINPKDVKTLNELAIVYKEQENYDKAIPIFKELIEKYNHFPSFNELALTYILSGDFNSALIIVNKGLKIEPLHNGLNSSLKLINKPKEGANNGTVYLKNNSNSDVDTPISTVVILTAIEEEYNAVRAHLTNIKDADQNSTGYEEGIFEHNDKKVAKVIIRECGAKNVVSSMEAERAIQYFTPDLMLFVGIAGSWKPQDFTVGDVIFPEKIFYYEGGKSGKDSIYARPDMAPTTYALYELAKKERNRTKWRRLIKGNWGERLNTVKADLGVIASGEQLIEHRDSELGQILVKHFNETQAVEMEGFGFAKAALRQGRETDHIIIGVVRGISDIVGQDDNSTSAADPRPTGNKAFAADTAAAFAFWLIYRTYIKENTQ
jgi:tetratricopeptide (TPR) repeat protein